jgi:hypothetical protein
MVWIDVPVDGLYLESPQKIQIEGHATAPSGISQVEIWVNGEIIEVVDSPPVEGDLASFSILWTLPDFGEYIIQAVAFARDGTVSEADVTRVQVGELVDEFEEGESVPSETPTPVGEAPTEVPTSTHTPLPDTVVQFWADPEQIAAGACTTIYWHVENVQRVVFGTIDQPFDGSYEDCLCESQTFPLSITYLDGTEEIYRVMVEVTGSCNTPSPTSPPTNTPTPPGDTQAPAAPSPFKPVNGVTLGCVSSTTVMWDAVTDPSGIAEYRVAAQRHSGDNNWQAVAGSPWKGIGGTSTSIPTECGWYYRWHVRAVDGEGNASSWSEWYKFTVSLQ